MYLLLDQFKALFMNAQYMIIYTCQALNVDEDTCPEEQQEVKVYGRTLIMSKSVQKMLTEISRPRTCVNLDQLAAVNFNS